MSGTNKTESGDHIQRMAEVLFSYEVEYGKELSSSGNQAIDMDSIVDQANRMSINDNQAMGMDINGNQATGGSDSSDPTSNESAVPDQATVEETNNGCPNNMTDEEIRARVVQILQVQDFYDQFIEEMVADMVIDKCRVYLFYVFEQPPGMREEDLMEWVAYCERIVDAIIAILRFLRDWAPKLPNGLVIRIVSMIDILRDISGTVIYSADITGHFNPLNPENRDTFVRHHNEMINRIR